MVTLCRCLYCGGSAQQKLAILNRWPRYPGGLVIQVATVAGSEIVAGSTVHCPWVGREKDQGWQWNQEKLEIYNLQSTNDLESTIGYLTV